MSKMSLERVPRSSPGEYGESSVYHGCSKDVASPQKLDIACEVCSTRFGNKDRLSLFSLQISYWLKMSPVEGGPGKCFDVFESRA